MDNKKSGQYFNKSYKLAKRVKDSKYFTLMIKLGLLISNDSSDFDIEELNLYKNNINYYKHWYLAFLANKDDICRDTARDLLNKYACKNSNKDHVKSCLNNISLHHKILSDLKLYQ